MSKDSWERAFGVADSTFELPEVDNENLSEMRRKQRELTQADWDKDLAASRKRIQQNETPVEEQVQVSWAEMYKSPPEPEAPVEVELTVEEQILFELENSGHFYKAQGVVGSLKMLINELNTTRQQLLAIKRAMGQ